MNSSMNTAERGVGSSIQGRLTTHRFFPGNVLWTFGGGGGGGRLPRDVSLTPKNLDFSQLIILMLART